MQWSQNLVDAGKKVDFDFSAAKKFGKYLKEAGFEDITIKWQNWPVGPWAKGAKNKQIGRWWAEDMKDVTRNSSAMFTRVAGWTQTEFDVFVAKIAQEIDEGKRHMWVEQ